MGVYIRIYVCTLYIHVLVYTTILPDTYIHYTYMIVYKLLYIDCTCMHMQYTSTCTCTCIYRDYGREGGSILCVLVDVYTHYLHLQTGQSYCLSLLSLIQTSTMADMAQTLRCVCVCMCVSVFSPENFGCFVIVSHCRLSKRLEQY